MRTPSRFSSLKNSETQHTNSASSRQKRRLVRRRLPARSAIQTSLLGFLGSGLSMSYSAQLREIATGAPLEQRRKGRNAGAPHCLAKRSETEPGHRAGNESSDETSSNSDSTAKRPRVQQLNPWSLNEPDRSARAPVPRSPPSQPSMPSPTLSTSARGPISSSGSQSPSSFQFCTSSSNPSQSPSYKSSSCSTTSSSSSTVSPSRSQLEFSGHLTPPMWTYLFFRELPNGKSAQCQLYVAPRDAPGSTLKVGRAAGQQRGLITISGLKPSKRGQKWDSVTRSQMTKHLKGSHTVVRED